MKNTKFLYTVLAVLFLLFWVWPNWIWHLIWSGPKGANAFLDRTQEGTDNLVHRLNKKAEKIRLDTEIKKMERSMNDANSR